MNARIQLFFKIGTIVILVLSFGAYGLYKAHVFLAGPKIIIESPKNGQVFQNSYVAVIGKASDIAFIFLDGKRIFVDGNGNFKENLLLARGYNIIEVRAADKFGREVKKIREVVLK